MKHLRELLRRHRFDLALCAAVVVLALLVRFPNVSLIPRFTDETNHMTWSAELATGQGGPLRLRALDMYRGPVFEYLVALLFRIFGLDPGLPRLVVMALGAATVGFAYLMGRLMKGPIAGLVAAGFLLTMPSHVIVNSHVAWANSATPFFTTLGLSLFYFGVQHYRGPWLAAGTFVLALGLQTHPLTLLFSVPLLIWFLARRDLIRWVRSPWPIAALLAAILGYWNMILYNVQQNFASFNQAADRGYALHIAADGTTYLDQLTACLSQFFGMITGDLGRLPDPMWYLTQLPNAIVVWAAIIGLIYALRRGNAFLLITTAGYLLLVAWVNQDYSFFQTRYLAPASPLTYVAIGIMVQDAVTVLWSHRHASREAGWGGKRDSLLVYGAMLVGALGLLGLMGQGIAQLNAFYQAETQRGYTNASFLSIARKVAERSDRAASVFVTPGMGITWELGGGAGSAVFYALDVWNAGQRWANAEELPHLIKSLATADAYFVTTPRSLTALRLHLPGYQFQQLEVSPPQQDKLPNRIGLYHLIAGP